MRETEIQYDIDDDPSTVVEDVVRHVERGERQILERGRPDFAERAFRRARQRNVMVLSAIQARYGLSSDEIKQFVGRDISETNDELMEICKRMAMSKVRQNKTNEAVVKETTLMDIQEVLTDLESFRDLLRGIEDGQVVIQNE